MPWQCKLLDIVGTVEVAWDPPEGGGKCGETLLLGKDGNEYSYDTFLPGTMFFLPKEPIRETRNQAAEEAFQRTTPWPWYWATEDWLSDYYRQNNSHRQPLFVVLPGRHLFLVDGKCFKDGEKYGGWTVTGEAPLITVHPSINIGGMYHGWLQNGVLSEDCEGRTYDELGYLPNR